MVRAAAPSPSRRPPRGADLIGRSRSYAGGVDDENARPLSGRVAVVTGASHEIGAAAAEELARAGPPSSSGTTRRPSSRRPWSRGSRRRRSCDRGRGRPVDRGRQPPAGRAHRRGARPARRLRRERGADAVGAVPRRRRGDLGHGRRPQPQGLVLRRPGGGTADGRAARRCSGRRDGSRIVFSSSVTGTLAIANASAYAVTKAGLQHMARVLALELGSHRITVNALAIGATVNERNLADDPDYADHWAGVLPAGRAGSPRDVASALAFLVDPMLLFRHRPHAHGRRRLVGGRRHAVTAPLAHDERGSGPAIVLVHGHPFSRRMWRGQLDSLSDAFRVVAPDLPGYGESPARGETITPRACWRTAVVELMDAIDVPRATVVGLSLGGLVAMELGLEIPRTGSRGSFSPRRPPRRSRRRRPRCGASTAAQLERDGMLDHALEMAGRLFGPAARREPRARAADPRDDADDLACRRGCGASRPGGAAAVLRAASRRAPRPGPRARGRRRLRTPPRRSRRSWSHRCPTRRW